MIVKLLDFEGGMSNQHLAGWICFSYQESSVCSAAAVILLFQTLAVPSLALELLPTVAKEHMISPLLFSLQDLT